MNEGLIFCLLQCVIDHWEGWGNISIVTVSGGLLVYGGIRVVKGFYAIGKAIKSSWKMK